MRHVAILLLAILVTAATVLVPAKAARTSLAGATDLAATVSVMRAGQAESPSSAGKRCHSGAGLLGCPFVMAGYAAPGAPASSSAFSPEPSGSAPDGRSIGTETPPPKPVSV